jgi:hypothetical protein
MTITALVYHRDVEEPEAKPERPKGPQNGARSLNKRSFMRFRNVADMNRRMGNGKQEGMCMDKDKRVERT